jgi:hypothetical protein
LRFATRQLGHALPSTTLGYARTIEIGTLAHLKTWRTPLNQPELHLPLLVLTTLLHISDRRGDQLVARFNAAFPLAPIVLRTPAELPNGEHLHRRGQPAHFLSLRDANRLVRWCLRLKRQQRGQAGAARSAT